MPSHELQLELAAEDAENIRHKIRCERNSEEELIDKMLEIEEDIPYSEFFTEIMAKNRPVIFKNYVQRMKWNSFTDWNEAGRPNLEHLLDYVDGSTKVPVSLCDSQYFNSQECVEMSLQDYIQYWNCDRSTLKYLKDWHLLMDIAKNGSTYRPYITPTYFASDWLNEWLDFRVDGERERNDYRFVYIGPKGSWTPFHADVFGSYSWSANIVGTKRWIFVLPGEEKKLKKSAASYVYDITRENEDLLQNINKIEVIQKAGDCIFVPSGWFHQVFNLEDTVSINHNWFNATNIHHIVRNLDQELERVKLELSDLVDLPDFPSVCQDLLRQHHGMNHHDLEELLNLIIQRRKELLLSQDPGAANVGPVHAQLDLDIAQQVKSLLANSTQLNSKI